VSSLPADDKSQVDPLLPGEVVFFRLSRIRNQSTHQFGYFQATNYRILFKPYALRSDDRRAVAEDCGECRLGAICPFVVD
jgi:hypothetical protein